MMITARNYSVDEWEARIGEQLRGIRLRAGMDQLQLAEAAGISIGAVRNLERGKGSTLKSLVRVARALDREDWLEALAPTVTISPIDRLRSAKTTRSRVYRPRREGQ